MSLSRRYWTIRCVNSPFRALRPSFDSPLTPRPQQQLQPLRAFRGRRRVSPSPVAPTAPLPAALLSPPAPVPGARKLFLPSRHSAHFRSAPPPPAASSPSPTPSSLPSLPFISGFGYFDIKRTLQIYS